MTDASVTDAQVESTLPPITLSLPNVTSGQPDVTIQGSALDTYLYDGGGGQFCLAIQDGGTQDPSTFGDAFLQAFVTIVDLQGGRVGFSPTGCAAPQVRRVPAPRQERTASRPAARPALRPRDGAARLTLPLGRAAHVLLHGSSAEERDRARSQADAHPLLVS